MNLSFWRLQRPGKMGGWRRLFVAGTLLLAVAVCAWAWHVQSPDMDAAETAEWVLSLWSIGVAALGIVLIALAAIDRSCIWVGNGFGLSPLVTRTGTAAVLAGLTLLSAVALLTRYETVMPEGGSLRTGELCIVQDRWTGEARPCTNEAVVKRYRSCPQPQRVEERGRGEAIWHRIVSVVAEHMEIGKWLPNLTGRI
ncbi:MAG: hypothetical protein KDJ64_10945 [Nitratireductor sp.]|nr:hypothetical protein [Nitratireductor sp.]